MQDSSNQWDDANAFAQSNEGKALGSNAGNDDFPFEVYFSKDTSIAVGTWINQHPESEAGYYWVKFNANAKFNGINYFIYAGDVPALGKWKLFKYNANIEATLSGTPVASGDISTLGNSWLSALLQNKMLVSMYSIWNMQVEAILLQQITQNLQEKA